MIKKVLLTVTLLIACPTVTRTALIQTELTYNVRNAKGIYPFVPYVGGNGQVNLANGNLVFSRTLVSRPGRAGFSADISLVYNSKIWDRVGGVMTIPEAGSWVGLGWRIGFPKLVQGSSSYAVVLSDGSSHEIVDFGDGVWKSMDSTYILFDPAVKTATLKGGVKLIFGNIVGNTTYMTEMKDTNGNQVKATYVAGTGKLSQVQDTLGVLANFTYGTDGMLQSIQSFGKTRDTITFTYSPLPSSYQPRFSMPDQLSQPENELVRISIIRPSGELRQILGYDGDYTRPKYGELSTVVDEVVQNIYGQPPQTLDQLRSQYHYSTFSFYDTTYGSIQERVVDTTTDYSDNTNYSVKYLAYTMASTKSNPSSVTVSEHVAGAAQSYRPWTVYTTYNLNYTISGRNWSDGLLQSLQSGASSIPTSPVLRTQSMTWTQDNPSLSFLVNPRITSQSVTLDDNQSTRTDVTYTIDGTGNVQQVAQYGFSGELLSTTTTTYLHESNPNYAALNMISLPSSVSVTNSAGTEVSRTEYTYDDFPLTTYSSIPNHDPVYSSSLTMRGNATGIRKLYKEANRYITTSKHYDISGNTVSVVDARGNTTTIGYSSTSSYAYPQTITNPLNQVTTYAWWQYYDSTSGLYFKNGDLASQTDPNAVMVSRLFFDDLGRKTLEITPAESKSFSYDDLAFLATSYTSSGYGYDTSNLTGNIIDAQHSDPSGQNIEQTANYDSTGQVVWQTVPYRAGDSTTFYTYTRDALGRTTVARLPWGGTISYQYTGNATQVTDADGRIKKYIYNALGKVYKVTEQDDQGNLTLDTTYSYDALGRLIQVVQGSQTRTYLYDSLGRLISEAHPENGTTSYTYDDNGNILTKTDARGVVTTNTYDGLNRLTGTTYSDGSPSATFSYDETGSSLIGLITNGKGRRTSAWTSDGIGYSWTYDAAGRALQQVYKIDGATYPITYSYTNSGCGCQKADLQSMTYPDGLQANYGRDSIGRITSISSPNYPNYPYVRNVEYNLPNGNPSRIFYSASVYGAYDSVSMDSLGRVYSAQDRLYDDGRGTTELTWIYSYQNGRINQMTENIWYSSIYFPSSQKQYAYQYDGKGRLQTATGQVLNDESLWETTWALTLAYDRYGNMQSKQSAPTAYNYWRNYSISYNVDQATNRLNSYDKYYPSTQTVQVSYDAAGQLLTEGDESYGYNAMGLMKEARRTSDNGQLGTYRYDAFGRRVKKSWNYLIPGYSTPYSGSTQYVYGVGGEIAAEYQNEAGGQTGTTNTTTDNILMNGNIVTRRVLGTANSENINEITWLHRNHLGEVVATETLNLVNNSNTTTINISQPFTSGGSDQFAGQKDDPETGLKDFGARYYNPTMARWTSPDSVTTHIYDPQSLNKYAYVRNDPVNLVDPDGRYAKGIIDPSPLPLPPMTLNSSDFISLGAWSSDAFALFTNPGYYMAQASAYAIAQKFLAIDQRAIIADAIALQKKWLKDPDSDCSLFVKNVFRLLFKNDTTVEAEVKEMFSMLPTYGPANFVPAFGTNYIGDPSVHAISDISAQTVTVYTAFFLDNAIGSAQTVIHELMHLASYSNDINIAEALGVWSLGSKDPNDPAVMGEASSAWDKELQKHCK